MIYVLLNESGIGLNTIPGIVPLCNVYVKNDGNSEILLTKTAEDIPSSFEQLNGLFTYISQTRSILDSKGNEVDLVALVN